MASHVHSDGSSPSLPESTSITELVDSATGVLAGVDRSSSRNARGELHDDFHCAARHLGALSNDAGSLAAHVVPAAGSGRVSAARQARGQLYGKRKVLLFAVAGAAVGSFISAIAPSYAILILGRSLTGLLVPCLFLSYSLIRDVFPPKTVALAVSIATSGMGLIAIPAPFLTGWLIDNHGFRSIFWFFVVGLVLLGGMIFASTAESTVRLRSFAGPDRRGTARIGHRRNSDRRQLRTDLGLEERFDTGLPDRRRRTCWWLGLPLPEPSVSALIDLRYFGKRSVMLTAVGAGFC